MLKAGHHSHDSTNVQVTSQDVKYVGDFPYLGAVVTSGGGYDVDIKSRIRKATTALYRLTKIWNSSSISHKREIKIFRSHIISVLMFGSETWKLTDEQ